MSKFNCEKCNKGFDLKADYMRHINRQKSCELDIPTMDIYECKICGYQTKIKHHYKQHINKKKPCTEKDVNDKILKKLDIMIQNDEKQKMEIQQLKQKIDKQKRPINYNFVINNYTNAANIEDCLKMENITQEIMDKCRNMPLKDGSTYVLNSLCDIEPELRPIHCTDINRHNYLVRSNNTWKSDAKPTQINEHLDPVISTLYTDIYKEKMGKEMTVDEKMELHDKMSTELVSDNISKCSQNALKISSTKYAIKNIDNLLQHDDSANVNEI